MGATSAFVCDGPKCNEITRREKGTRAPDDWLRVTLVAPGALKRTGSFHDRECAVAWVDLQLATGEV